MVALKYNELPRAVALSIFLGDFLQHPLIHRELGYRPR
jgi:hypothetical protein